MNRLTTAPVWTTLPLVVKEWIKLSYKYGGKTSLL